MMRCEKAPIRETVRDCQGTPGDEPPAYKILASHPADVTNPGGLVTQSWLSGRE
jgi:hypothetical protein